jgi:hypothetical protein
MKSCIAGNASYLSPFQFQQLICYVDRTPFVVPKDKDAVDSEEAQAVARKKLFENILTYHDNLVFERWNKSKTRVSGDLAPGAESSAVDSDESGWAASSNAAKVVMLSLIKANASQRLTADALLAHPWIASLSDTTSSPVTNDS